MGKFLKSNIERIEQDKLTRREIVEAVAAWHATPTVMRKSANLAELASELNVTPNGHFYALADSAECYQMVLVNHSGSALKGMPDIMNVLHRMATDPVRPSVRAAEVYLDTIRKTITDTNMMSKLAPTNTFQETMVEAEKAARSLVDFAKSKLPEPLPQLDAEYAEIPDAVVSKST